MPGLAVQCSGDDEGVAGLDALEKTVQELRAGRSVLYYAPGPRCDEAMRLLVARLQEEKQRVRWGHGLREIAHVSGAYVRFVPTLASIRGATAHVVVMDHGRMPSDDELDCLRVSTNGRADGEVFIAC